MLHLIALLVLAQQPYQSYDQITKQLTAWSHNYPATIGNYGMSSQGTKLYYIRLGTQGKPKVLITAAIHGNEPLSTDLIMSYIDNLLKTNHPILKERELLFVPSVSPDSFRKSRFVDDVDPNRNFPGPHNPKLQSIAPITALQNLFKQEKPQAVISAHTSGRLLLIPHGDQNNPCPHDAIYRKILEPMSKLTNYKIIQANRMHRKPIRGSELDWYYRQGCLAIVMEMGTGNSNLKQEFALTWPGFIHFLQEAPLVEIK